MNELYKARTVAIEDTLKARLEGRKPSVSFEEVWDRYSGQDHGSKQSARSRTVRVWCAFAAALLLMVCIGFTPPVRAALTEFLEVNIIKNKRDHASIVHHWDVQRKWDEARSYLTLEEAVKSVGAPFPVPAKLAEYERDALNKEYRVTTEHGHIAGYFFSIRTNERMLDVTAKYEEPAAPSFTATSRAQAIVKDTTVNGQPAKLFAVEEFSGYTLYFKSDGWQFVITGYASGVGSIQPAPFTEDEILQIAQSIR